MNDPAQPSSLRELVAEVLGVNVREVTEESGPLTLPAWTSRKHLELVVSVEELFGVTLSSQDIMRLRSVAAVRSVLATKGVLA